MSKAITSSIARPSKLVSVSNFCSIKVVSGSNVCSIKLVTVSSICTSKQTCGQRYCFLQMFRNYRDQKFHNFYRVCYNIWTI